MPTGRHNNQDRIVAPEQDMRLRTIAQACVRSGFPPQLCDILAEGFIARLRRRCWEKLSDDAGDGDDVERALCWTGPPRVLAKALESAGYLRDRKGSYLASDAIAEAPEYIKARWRRHSKQEYDAAAARASANPNVIHPRQEPVEEPDEDGEPVDTLFGTVPDEGEKRGDSAHAKFSRRWDERYRQVYPKGYLWGRKSDERHIKELIEAFDSLTECFAAIDAYFADRTAWTAGHPLWKFRSGIDKYRVGAGGAVGGTGRNPGKSQARTGSVIAKLD